MLQLRYICSIKFDVQVLLIFQRHQSLSLAMNATRTLLIKNLFGLLEINYILDDSSEILVAIMLVRLSVGMITLLRPIMW